MHPLSPKRFADRLIELYGGHTEFQKALDERFEYVKRQWDKDTHRIGRILRAHLFLEHFLTLHLKAINPSLGDLDSARLSFSQKIQLINTSEVYLNHLIGGLKHLNKIRNRLAHDLSATVTEVDRDIFLQNLFFAAFRDRGAHPELPSENPLDVIEEFARYAGTVFHHTADPKRHLWDQAISESLLDTAEQGAAANP